MARIMCAQPLWRALRDTGLRTADGDARAISGIALARWAATTQRIHGVELVLATEAFTHLTVVFSLDPRGRFREAFATALDAVLEDFGVGAYTRLLECTVAETAPIVRLEDRAFAALLKTAAIYCDIERCDTADLRTLQRRLNDAPLADGCPAELVPELFSTIPSRAAAH